MLGEKRFIPVTKKGYSLFEVSSALQKAIRRGEEKPALYWAYELERSGFYKYLWYRLKIVAMEDVGLANPECHLQVRAAELSYEDFRKRKSNATLLALAHGVIVLVRSQKSRLSDWACCYMREVHCSENLSIPDEALDKHTQRGRERGKTIDDFFASGCKLNDHEVFAEEEEYMEFVRHLWCDMSQQEQDNFRSRATTLPEDHPDRMGKFSSKDKQTDFLEGVI